MYEARTMKPKPSSNTAPVTVLCCIFNCIRYASCIGLVNKNIFLNSVHGLGSKFENPAPIVHSEYASVI